MANGRRRPSKPVAPMGGLVFPKKGAPYKISEELPPEKDGIERFMVDSFLASLREEHGRTFGEVHKPRHPAVWPDFELESVEGVTGVELVALVDPEDALRMDIRDKYAVAITELLEDLRPSLDAFDVVFQDQLLGPLYPVVHSTAGRRLAREIADNIRNEVTNLSHLLSGFRHRRWRDSRGEIEFDAIFERRANASSDPLLVRFNPVLSYYAEKRSSLLAEIIERKIGKETYRTYPGPLWLVVHPGSRVHAHADSAAIEIARRWLAACGDSPFEEVWYSYPLARTGLAHIDRLYP